MYSGVNFLPMVPRCSWIDHAARLVEHLPAALPRHVAEVGVFQVEGRQQLVEAAQLQKLCAGRRRTIRRRRRSTGTDPSTSASMRCRTRSAPSCHQPCVRPVSSRSLSGSLKKIWQETANTSGSRKPSSSGARKSGVHPHVAVQQHHDVVLRRAEAGIRAAAEAQIRSAAPAPSPAGNAARRNSALPSVDPLSTTTISFSGLPASAVDRSRADTSPAGRCRSSWESRRVARVARDGRRCGSRRCRPRRVQNRSVSASASTADRHQQRREQQQRQRAQQRVSGTPCQTGRQLRAQPDLAARASSIARRGPAPSARPAASPLLSSRSAHAVRSSSSFSVWCSAPRAFTSSPVCFCDLRPSGALRLQRPLRLLADVLLPAPRPSRRTVRHCRARSPARAPVPPAARRCARRALFQLAVQLLAPTDCSLSSSSFCSRNIASSF